jgi:hypothetical protein
VKTTVLILYTHTVEIDGKKNILQQPANGKKRSLMEEDGERKLSKMSSLL